MLLCCYIQTLAIPSSQWCYSRTLFNILIYLCPTQVHLHFCLEFSLSILFHLCPVLVLSSYLHFYQDQELIVQDYPGMVQEELQRYDGSLCVFFEVDRVDPQVSFILQGGGGGGLQSLFSMTNDKTSDKSADNQSGSKDFSSLSKTVIFHWWQVLWNS